MMLIVTQNEVSHHRCNMGHCYTVCFRDIYVSFKSATNNTMKKMHICDYQILIPPRGLIAMITIQYLPSTQNLVLTILIEVLHDCP